MLDVLSNVLDKDIKNFCLNTGTMLDIASGRFYPGYDGKMYLDGGIFGVSSIIGYSETFKSAVGGSIFSKVLHNYPESNGICYDTEFSIADVQRINALNSNVENLVDRVYLCDKSDYNMVEFYDFIKEIVAEKRKKKKSLLVETPFINIKTGKRFLSLIPTIILIDSWSLMQSSQEQEIYDKGGLGDPKSNTAWMVDGNKKTIMMRQLPRLGNLAGIYFIPVAHLGGNIKLNPYEASKKDLQNMRASDSIKAAGSQFKYLSSTCIETRKCNVLQDSTKKCLYPAQVSSNVELNEVTVMLVKCKNNESGNMYSHVVSKSFGIQSVLEYFHLLKAMNLFGIDEEKKTMVCKMTPDKPFTRLTLRDKIAKDYELARGIELMGQLCYIRKFWTIDKKIKNLTATRFVDEIKKSKKLDMNRVLNSKGTWNFSKKGKKDNREYMSIFDILTTIFD